MHTIRIHNLQYKHHNGKKIHVNHADQVMYGTCESM